MTSSWLSKHSRTPSSQLCWPSTTGNKLSLLNSILGVPITPKLHVMAEHVLEWVDKHGKALGQHSEQAVEAVHSNFDTLWGSFRVKDDQSEVYLRNCLKATL